MKKHCLVITAYQELGFLKELCAIYSKYFNVYVHIDQKSQGVNDVIVALNKIDNVTAISRYKINWGSFYHIKALIDLLQLACDDKNDYVHILSANTILTKNPSKLFAFFEQYPNDIFMEIKHDDGSSFREFGYRYQGYFFQHVYNLRGRLGFVLVRLEDVAARLQSRIKMRRNIRFDWKGYVYCHMPIGAVEFLMKYIFENPSYLREIKYCYVGEEFFFQNIFMNSEWKARVHNDTLIYDLWSPERGNPAELNINDYDTISKSNTFFARKVSARNRKLWDKIRQMELI